jgi:tRNA(Ile)-lysidine synthase
MFAHKAAYREDSTNALSDYKRNRIRNEAFPIFASVNPSFVRTLNREMGYFAEAGEIVEDWCRSAAPSVVKEDCNGLRIDIQALMAKRYWRYLLYYILEPYGFNSSVLASLEDLLASERTVSGKKFESSSHVLLTGRNDLHVTRIHPSSECGSDEVIMPVRGEGIYYFNGRRFKVEVVGRESIESLKQPEGVIMLDAGRLRFPFVLRRWRKGDWFIPFGMHGKKKISDLFTDLRYDVMMKAGSVMIIDTMSEGMAENQHVAGVACVRIDNMYRVGDKTSSIIRITEIK